MKLQKKWVGAMALASVAISGTAQAACWTPAEADAAAVRDLQSRLMVATLRCARSEHDLLADYNRFVGSKKPLLQMGNKVLKQHFAKGKNRRQAQKAYDRYAVSLANRYGAGSGDLSECAGMALRLQRDRAANRGSTRLLDLCFRRRTRQTHSPSPNPD